MRASLTLLWASSSTFSLRFCTSPFWSWYLPVRTSSWVICSPVASFTCLRAHSSLPCSSVVSSVLPMSPSMVDWTVCQVPMVPCAVALLLAIASAWACIFCVSPSRSTVVSTAFSPMPSTPPLYASRLVASTVASRKDLVASVKASCFCLTSMKWPTSSEMPATPAAMATPQGPMSTEETPLSPVAALSAPSASGPLSLPPRSKTFSEAMPTTLPMPAMSALTAPNAPLAALMPTSAVATPAMAGASGLTVPTRSFTTSQAPLKAGAMSLATPATSLKTPLMPPFTSFSTDVMLSRPMESITLAMPLVTALPMFSKLVCRPPAAVSAWVLNDVMPLPPRWSSSTILPISSSMEMEAHLMPSGASFSLPPPSA